MTSAQFVAFVEQKFAELGVAKLVPGEEVLSVAFRRAWGVSLLQEAIDRATCEVRTGTVPDAPEDLSPRLSEAVTGTGKSWDAAGTGCSGSGAVR